VSGSTVVGNSGCMVGGMTTSSSTGGSGARDGAGILSRDERDAGGIEPLSSGGSGPDGSIGVTRWPVLIGVEGGARSLIVGAVTSEGSDPTLSPAKGPTQATAPPPLVPEQLQVQGPCPLTALEIPAEHRPLRGAAKVGTPLAGPHAPVTGAGGCSGAVQLTVMPPFSPRQFQFQGPLPLTPVAEPVEHNSSIGCVSMATPFAAPQRPFTAGPGGKGAGGTFFCVVQELGTPPLKPEHVQLQGPSP